MVVECEDKLVENGLVDGMVVISMGGCQAWRTIWFPLPAVDRIGHLLHLKPPPLQNLTLLVLCEQLYYTHIAVTMTCFFLPSLSDRTDLLRERECNVLFCPK